MMICEKRGRGCFECLFPDCRDATSSASSEEVEMRKCAGTETMEKAEGQGQSEQSKYYQAHKEEILAKRRNDRRGPEGDEIRRREWERSWMKKYGMKPEEIYVRKTC